MNSVREYDSVFFQSHSTPERHIRRLWSIAMLMGLSPAAPSQCSVLEIGCATGANLLAQAVEFPDSRFTGFDLSAAQIAAGERQRSMLQISNVELFVGNITDIEHTSTGQYDYILCHGLYSWVPRSVQESILKLSRKALRPHGVASISFNALPGWSTRGVVRRLLLAQDVSGEETSARVRRARETLQELFRLLERRENSFSRRLRFEAANCDRHSDAFILHELLAPEVHAYTLSEFIDGAAGQGLGYLGDGAPQRMRAFQHRHVEGEAFHLCQRDPVLLEQFLDRREPIPLRNALLCHADAPRLSAPDPSRLAEMYMNTPLVPLSESVEDAGSRTHARIFVGPGERFVEVSSPYVEQLLLRAHAHWPCPIPLSNSSVGDATRQEHLRDVLQLFLDGSTDLFSEPVKCCSVPSEAPSVLPLVRFQAGQGGAVTTALYESYAPNSFERILLEKLDGSRARAVLIQEMHRALDGGELSLSSTEGAGVSDEQMGEMIDQSLQIFAEAALLRS